MDTARPRIFFFGCPLDSDERYEAFLEKQLNMLPAGLTGDPYDAVMDLIAKEIPETFWVSLGSLPVPEWLRPIPSAEVMPAVTAEAMVAFIDQNGCRTTTELVREFVSSKILPNIPCLIGVDHSLAGGSYRAVAEWFGTENVSLIIIDSHTDAIPMKVLSEAISYDMDTNPNSFHDPSDPLIYNRTDSYNASSFVYHLIAEKVVIPRNLYFIGVGDYPDKKATRIKDPRMSRYVEAYTRLKRQGVGVLTKNDLVLKPSKLKNLLKRMKTKYLYVSIDMDIGADNALEGVRFHNRKGISEKQMYWLADTLCQFIQSGIQLVGMDLCEFNPRRAGGIDRTYRIAASLISRIALQATFLRQSTK